MGKDDLLVRLVVWWWLGVFGCDVGAVVVSAGVVACAAIVWSCSSVGEGRWFCGVGLEAYSGCVGANGVWFNLNLAGINVDAVRVLQLAWAVVWSISKLPDAGF